MVWSRFISPSDRDINQIIVYLSGQNGVKWYECGSEKGDKQENAGKRGKRSVRRLPSLSHPSSSSPRRFRPAQRQRHGRATGFAEASCAQSQGADYYHGPWATSICQTASAPSNRPSVAVRSSPLLCRILETHTVPLTTIHPPPFLPVQPYRIPQACPTRSQRPLPPTRSLRPRNRKHKPRMRPWDRPQDKPSRRNRATM